MKQQFIIAYTDNEANIRSRAIDETFCRHQMSDMYAQALSKYPDRSYGDSVIWNNQFWCVVTADNAEDALQECIKKGRTGSGFI